MKQLAFHVNSDKCISCKACVIACKDKNNLKPGYKFRKVYSVSAGDWDKTSSDGGAYSYSISIACNHCANPACKANCPANAIGKRSDGIVYIDHELCIGCGNCTSACPYGAPSLSKEELKTRKCDFCRELVEMGESPACVAACSMQAIDFGDLDALKAKYPKAANVQQVYPIAGPEQTQPSLIITRHRKYTGNENGATADIFNMPEELQGYEV
jgi:anaerobic dimethyl sulfoxide reductase subunit B (iron-sulfur subunit)